ADDIRDRIFNGFQTCAISISRFNCRWLPSPKIFFNIFAMSMHLNNLFLLKGFPLFIIPLIDIFLKLMLQIKKSSWELLFFSWERARIFARDDLIKRLDFFSTHLLIELNQSHAYLWTQLSLQVAVRAVPVFQIGLLSL